MTALLRRAPVMPPLPPLVELTPADEHRVRRVVRLLQRGDVDRAAVVLCDPLTAAREAARDAALRASSNEYAAALDEQAAHDAADECQDCGGTDGHHVPYVCGAIDCDRCCDRGCPTCDEDWGRDL